MKTSPVEPSMESTSPGSGFLAMWFAVEGADQFVLERFGAPAVTLPPTETVYSWHPDLACSSTSPGPTVLPEFVVVEAYSGERLSEVLSWRSRLPVRGAHRDPRLLTERALRRQLWKRAR